MKINNIEIEFDFFDADCIEKFENACKKVEDKTKNSEIKTLSYAEAIKEECKIVKDFFDEIFGEGTSLKIFGEKNNILECIKAFTEIVNEKNTRQAEFQKITNRYQTNNRDFRRKNKYGK